MAILLCPVLDNDRVGTLSTTTPNNTRTLNHHDFPISVPGNRCICVCHVGRSGDLMALFLFKIPTCIPHELLGNIKYVLLPKAFLFPDSTLRPPPFITNFQFAKYSKSSPSRSDKNNSSGVHSVKPDSTSHRWKPILSGVHCNQSTSYPITYADILKGKSNGKAKMVEVKESGFDWLHMSVVGILNSYCDVNSLQDFFITNGIWDADIRSLGGLNVLLSFDSSESLNSFLEDKDKVLPKWFSSVEAWANQSIKSSRCVWISFFGVPLNAWCSSTFINIGKLWGDVIKLDEFTENSIAFDKGRMFILTDFLDCINEVVHVKINDDIYPVKVIEDPMAETCWEKRVFTSIKINRKLDSDRKENVVEIDPLDDDSIELDDLDAQEEIIGVNSKMDLPELELDNKHYNPDDLGLCDGSRAGVFEKESNVVGEGF
ncbi:hypothetical protein Vadar_001752 [Vaccinium darrowii]|uniref:Uncharacterized protein n=1 Tax=Vaccinium darrowii TaxID=229202 RepID=A0ACB7XWR9_9ERIC|nr:hypothetical protein Vadar_001752 [Vaccinium darrowii]